ncbi:hypothetical protein PAMP_007563 [Pampus punctatissimus]
MSSKTWPRTTCPCLLDSSKHLGRHTDSSIFMQEDRTSDERTESTKRKDNAEETPQRANKRSRKSQSPSQEHRQPPHLSSTSDKPSTSAAANIDQNNRKGCHTDSSIFMQEDRTSDCQTESTKRKDTTEEMSQRATKRSRKSQSPSQEHRQPPYLSSISDKPSSSTADVSKKSSKCQMSHEEAEEQPKKRSRKTQSPHEGHSHTSTEEAATSTSKSTCQTDRAEFKAKYEEKQLLSKGGYGLVFAGIRRNDNMHVAIKHIPQEDVDRIPFYLNEKMSNVPREVALLIAVGAGPDATTSNITPVLMDWYDLDEELILVLERPVPCLDLIDFLNQTDSYMEEYEVQALQRQLVVAALEMYSKGVFHRDIKLENILIEIGSEVPRVRFIDFGLGTMHAEKVHTMPQGTEVYTSPEWFRYRRYTAGPTTVWQLGVVLYGLLHKTLPFLSPHEIIYCNPPIRADFSDACKDFLRRCLAKCPQDRPTLESLLNHPWLQ